MKTLLRSIVLPLLVALLAGCGEKQGGSGQCTVGVAFETLQTVGLVLIIFSVLSPAFNPYLYPLITGGVIFLAVFLDALRCRILTRLTRR